LLSEGFLSFSVSAVGDISFQGVSLREAKSVVFDSVRTVFEGSDIVIANLECPLIAEREGTPVVGKCTLRGSTAWAETMKAAGIQLVSLANNHMMDFGEAGLLSTVSELDRVGLWHVGAGRDIEEACRAKVVTGAGKRLAVLARSSVVVASPSYAGVNIPGVARLDVEETVEAIKECKRAADYVVLLLHWGIEEYRYPAPEQRRWAERFVDAGLDLLLGHHPHVIQGLEKINNSLVHYSAGNFVFDEFNWSFINRDGEVQEAVSEMSGRNRQGMVLRVEFEASGLKYKAIQTKIEPSGAVFVDESEARARDFEALCKRLNWPAYRFWWPVYAAFREIDLRILPLVRGKFTWEKIKKIRPSHLTQLAGALKRSLRIASEKSTNPYE